MPKNILNINESEDPIALNKSRQHTCKLKFKFAGKNAIVVRKTKTADAVAWACPFYAWRASRLVLISPACCVEHNMKVSAEYGIQLSTFPT